MRVCEALFKDVSSQFGPGTIEKCFTNPHLIFCSFFLNRRLGGIKIQFSHHRSKGMLPNEGLGRRNKDEMRIFEELFKGVST